MCARCSVSEAGAVAWLMVGLVADGGAGGEQSCPASVTAVSVLQLLHADNFVVRAAVDRALDMLERA